MAVLHSDKILGKKIHSLKSKENEQLVLLYENKMSFAKEVKLFQECNSFLVISCSQLLKIFSTLQSSRLSY